MKKSMLVAMVMMVAGMAAGGVICSGDSTLVAIDLRDEPVVDIINISWNAAWVGNNTNATIVITDNGEEVKRATGEGEFAHALSGGGRHELAYTTCIDGIAQDEVCSVVIFKDWKYNVADDGVIVVETSLKSDAVEIPSEIDGLGVIGVGSNVFSNCSDLTSVTIPDSVTSIGESAFYNCSSLTNVTIGSGVTNIGPYSFYCCSGLTSVTIPNSVTSIGQYAFDGCSGLKDMVVPQYVIDRQIRNVFSSSYSSITNVAYSSVITNIGPSAFSGCSGLTSVTIPNSATSIGSSAFSGCSGLTSVTIPDSVTTIGDRAFSGCRALTSITIPGSVTSIGSSVFSGCGGLEEMTLPFIGAKRGNTGSSDSLFGYIFGTSSYSGGTATKQYYSGSSYSTYYIPSSLKTVVVTDEMALGYGAFNNCSGLANVEMPNSMTSIGRSAFSGCGGLTSVEIPNSVTNIGFAAFQGCGELTTMTLPFVGSSRDHHRGSGAVLGCLFGHDSYSGGVSTWQRYSDDEPNNGYRYYIPASLRSVTITDAVVVGYGAFYGCNGLTNVTIRNNVDSIGPYAFYCCSGLANVTIPDAVTNIAKYAFYACGALSSVIIPNSVTSIEYEAFYACSGLTSVTIPDSVTSIGSGAFSGCSGLTSVTIGNGVTTIGGRAFYGCSGLTSVTIPDGVTIIGSGAFSGCSGLTSVTIPDSVIDIGSGAFSGCSGLISITMPEVVCDLGLSTVFPAAYQTISNVHISDSVTNIADYAFAGCTNLQTEVWGGYRVLDGWLIGYTDEAEETIPDADKLKGICSEALKGCTALKRLGFGDSARLVSIGAEALKGCTELKTLVLPPSLTRIGDEAFMGCSYLDNVIVPGSVKSVGARAFKNCTGFTWAQIEHGVESIGQEAFYGCWRITEVDIPSSVSSIGVDAFGGDSSITKVALRGDSRKVSEIFSTYAQITEATVKPGTGALVDGLFSGCARLKSVFFIGNCPELQNGGRNLYEGTPYDNWDNYCAPYYNSYEWMSALLVTYVDKDSTGWDGTPGSHVLPMKWPLEGNYRREIMYTDAVSTPCAVAFDANGGTPKMQSEEQISESLFVLPNEPTREGYVFMGWWTEKNGGVKVTDETVFLTGVYETLYAHWLSERVVQAQVLEKVFSGVVRVELGEDGHIVVTLILDVNGTVDIPDNVGPVTIDLNGHNMVGDDGGLGETALPGGPAIRVVKGDGEGGATRLAIVDSSEGEKGQISGGGESAGIEVAEDAATGVKLDVEEGVGVFNGDGTEQELKPKLVGTGKVTVPKTWKVGQKVTWKAVADKGSVFAHWEGPLVDSLNLTKNERRNPSLAFSVPEDFDTNMVTVVFLPIDDDGLYSLGITQTEFELKESVFDVRVTDDSQSYVTASASGLPTGLKFDAKKMTITGTPTKGGVYWVQIKAKNASGYRWAENVKVTVSGGGAEAKEPKLTRTAYYPLTVICANEGGTVSGTGVYAEGKKVSIKATPAKGYVFAGWHETANSEKGAVNGVDGADYRSASLNVTVPETRYVFALFATKEDDADSLKVAVEDVTTEKDGTMALDLGACVSSLSLPKLAVSGLPTGLKYDAKSLKISGKATKPGVYTVTVKATNAAVTKATDASTATFRITVPNFECAALPGLKPETDAYGIVRSGVIFDDGLVDCTPADGWTVKVAGLPSGLKWDAKTGKIVGVPTAKAGSYTVTFTASKKGEANQIATITLNVEALPTWVVGTFDGSVIVGGAPGDRALPCGLVAMTVAANGKISGKVIDADGTWALSAAAFDSVEGPVSNVEELVFHATVIGKSGKMTITNEVEIAAEEVAARPESAPYLRGALAARSVIAPNQNLEPGVEWCAWQNLWKTEPWKTDAKAFAKARPVEIQVGGAHTSSDRLRGSLRSGDTGDRALPYGVVTLKFAATGAVTASGKFVTGQDASGRDIVYSATCSSVLIPDGDGVRISPEQSEHCEAMSLEACAPALPDALDFRVFLYFAPKAGKFDGFGDEIPFVWDGGDFSVK